MTLRHVRNKWQNHLYYLSWLLIRKECVFHAYEANEHDHDDECKKNIYYKKMIIN